MTPDREEALRLAREVMGGGIGMAWSDVDVPELARALLALAADLEAALPLDDYEARRLYRTLAATRADGYLDDGDWHAQIGMKLAERLGVKWPEPLSDQPELRNWKLEAAERNVKAAEWAMTRHAEWYRASEARAEAAERDLATAREELRGTVKLALQLHAMIPREVWRSQGGDDQQGHYEGDYHAEYIETQLIAALRSLDGE